MVHALAVVLIAVGLMNSSADLRAQPQPKAGLWTWTDRYGKTRSRGDLEKILETWKHKTMGHCQGAKEISEFTGILGNDNDLRGAHLRDADLRHVWLNCVDLSGSGLYNANLSGNELFGTNFSHANLSSANLSFADLSCPFKALDDTFFTGDEIGGSYLGHCKGANLSDADLTFANLSHADLTGVDLSDANLLGTNVAYAIFEPTTGPQAAGIAYAGNCICLPRHLRVSVSPCGAWRQLTL